MWMKTWRSRYAKIAKQNVSRVSGWTILLAKYLRKLVVITLRIPVMCFAHGSLQGRLLAKSTLSSIGA